MGAAAQRHVHPLGFDALDPGQQLDVRADLEHGARLDVAGELGVRHLVVVRAETRWSVRGLDAEQEVGVAAPRSVEEGGLVDDVGTLGDGVAGRGGRRAQLIAAVLDRAVELDAGHGLPLGVQIVEEALLVLEPALADDVQLRVVAFRSHGHARHRGALELRQMLAGEIADEVRGGVDRPAVDRLHVATTIPGRRVSLPVTRSLRFARGGEATRRRGQALGRSDVGEHRRAADPRGDGGRRVRRAALPGTADPARRRLGGRRARARVPGAAQCRRGAAVDRGRQGGPRAPGSAGRAAGAGGCRGYVAAGSRSGCAAAFERVVAEANRAIERLNAEAPTDRQHRRPLDPEAELARLEAAFRP